SPVRPMPGAISMTRGGCPHAPGAASAPAHEPVLGRAAAAALVVADGVDARAHTITVLIHSAGEGARRDDAVSVHARDELLVTGVPVSPVTLSATHGNG
ncbi:hypothetical protein, partial [Streptomyces sp. 13-12-16]|uniref:hypothetical protein n=1 Tax=Streptomyces sp. 13-12-16 TaxID=1570823 RepID=UPI001C4EC258